jgi:hypothetical protein
VVAAVDGHPWHLEWLPHRQGCGEPHSQRCSAIDGLTGRHKGYAKSIHAKKRIEQVFGWIKQAAGLRKPKARVRSKLRAVFRLPVVAYNLISITNLFKAQAAMVWTWPAGPKVLANGLRTTLSCPS